MITKKNVSTIKLKTLSERANEAYDQGYSENFKVQNRKLTTTDGKSGYGPAEVTIENTFRFEGYSGPQGTSILYLIKTRNGKKGTLIDAYGVYADTPVSSFIRAVTDIQKNQ